MQFPTELYLEERRQEILDLLHQSGRASVTELSQRFGVSEVTIRADLHALAERNLIVRTHGGAVPANQGMTELALVLRRQRQVRQKWLIGQAGAAMIQHGDAVFLDSSSTSLAIAHQLKAHRHLTVISNSLEVARELLDAPGVEVVLVGGILQRETASLIGGYGLEDLRRYNLQKGFFGAHGIDLDHGLTDVSSEEAAIKRPFVELCSQVIAVVDATKWGRSGVASFAKLNEIDCVISDHAAPHGLVDQVRALGVELILTGSDDDAN